MRVVIQRVKEAKVKIDGVLYSEIKQGVLIFLGITQSDTPSEAQYLVEKIQHLRIFEDMQGKLNLSLQDIHGQVLIVSQFTLYADCRKGRRPSFTQVAPPEKANSLYEFFVESFRKTGLHVETGKFQAMMDIVLINCGPVTLILDSQNR